MPSDTKADKNETIHNKLAKILGEISRVPKNGYNTHHKYPYVTESDLLDYIRPLLAKHGISITVSVENVVDFPNLTGSSSFITQVECLITITDGIQSITTKAFGRGIDTQEKGIYKAITGAIKYWLFKNFLVSTGDDPETDTKEPDNETAKLQQHWNQANEWKRRILDAKTIAELNDFVDANKERFASNPYAQELRNAVAAQKTKLSKETVA